MIYTEKTYEEIFESMLTDSLEQGLISHASEFESYIANREDISNYYVMDKSVIAQMFAQVYQDITSVYESAKVEYAEGSDLDDIGKIVGVARPPATHSEVRCEFTLTGSVEENENINLNPGVIISTSSDVEYVTLEEISIPYGESSCSVLCRAVEAGFGSRILENTITKIVTDVPYSLTVVNPDASKGGENEYSDDEYRYFLLNWLKIQLKGSLEAFEYYFANVDGVDDYRLVPNWDGAGTLKIVVDPGDSSTLNRIYNELKESVCQIDDVPVMFAPIDKYISITAKVNVDIDVLNPYSQNEKEEIRSRIISGIKVFIDGGRLTSGDWYSGLGLGEDFIPHKLAVFLDDEIPELKNITFTTPDDYVSILDEERAVSDEINIEMI